MSDFERYLLLILGANAFCTLLVSAAIVDVKNAIKGIREDLGSGPVKSLAEAVIG